MFVLISNYGPASFYDLEGLGSFRFETLVVL